MESVVHVYLVDSISNPTKRAIGMAHKVIDIDKPEDMAFVEAM